MKELKPENRDERVLILAPTGRDASLTGKYLAETGIRVEPCVGMEELCDKLRAGAGAALISEEALVPEALQCLVEALSQQPTWSDFPLVILSSSTSTTPASMGTLRSLSEVGNMTLIERPTRVITLVSAIQSALRARRRQYQVRDHLEAERRAQQEADAARRQAEEANRAKDLFLATLSHELRTPLTAVLGWSRMLRTMKLDAETMHHGLQIIERNAESQNQLIRDLLDVSRIITGKLRLESKPVALIPVIEAAVDSMRQAIEARAVELKVEVDTETDLVRGDPDRLQQVVWNLLSNAIKFTPKGGNIYVSLARRGSEVQIKVADSGQGIPPEFLPHVFERFRQADGSTTREQGGLGLGLAVVRHLVEQHGGTVNAESLGEGRGATFTVNLPITAVNEQAEPAPDRSEQSAVETQAINEGKLNGLRVLVVDDQPDARELLSMVLSHAGAEVITAASAAAGFEKLVKDRPDLLVSDIGMPAEDGFALISRIRALRPTEGGNTQAIALTAYATEEDRRRALAAGFAEHLSKPVEPGELVAAVAALANQNAK